MAYCHPPCIHRFQSLIGRLLTMFAPVIAALEKDGFNPLQVGYSLIDTRTLNHTGRSGFNPLQVGYSLNDSCNQLRCTCRFQSLIGRLLTVFVFTTYGCPQGFQSLIGRLLTRWIELYKDKALGFQSLIGRLLTEDFNSVCRFVYSRFNPLQVGYSLYHEEQRFTLQAGFQSLIGRLLTYNFIAISAFVSAVSIPYRQATHEEGIASVSSDYRGFNPLQVGYSLSSRMSSI